jgi:secreted trypsin-like serine protease
MLGFVTTSGQNMCTLRSIEYLGKTRHRLVAMALLCLILMSHAKNHLKEYLSFPDKKSIHLKDQIRYLKKNTLKLDGDIQPRIIGGTPVPEGRYPYIAALFQRDPKNGAMVQVCGGSLISPSVVLTAAHCSDSIDLAIIGLLDLTKFEGVNYEYHEISADQKVMHPSYDPRTQDGDFLLVFLNNSSQATPVMLNSISSVPTDGQQLTVIGWGVDQTGSPTNLAEETVVRAVPNSECNVRYFFDASSVTKTQLCASGGSTHDSCQGDSGGPLIVKGDNADTDLLLGLVSWGSDCADLFYPGVYARVSSAANWIHAKVPDAKFNQNVSDVPPNGEINCSSECWDLIFFCWC